MKKNNRLKNYEVDKKFKYETENLSKVLLIHISMNGDKNMRVRKFEKNSEKSNLF